MRVVITGATGSIGRALVQTLIGRGDHVIAWTRDKSRAAGLLGPSVQLASGDEIDAAVDGADAIINLAGESIIGRWTDSKKKRPD